VTLSVADGAAVRTVASIPGIASTPRFSPDGKRIALLMTIGAAKEAGATQAGVRQVGEIGEASDEQRLGVFDRATTTPAATAADRQVSPAGRYIYEYDWTPDGRGFVAGAGLSNWVSYYGTNGIDQWMLPFFGKTLYDDRAAYEKVSAINFIRKAKTPTFIYVGERDIEVPPTQSVEYWHALRDQGVPTSLVIYPDEGHGIRDPEHTADLRRRTIAWFDRYLKAAAR
jgi:dipeptidyl aminopeptidase/acylaminoacyl peptidase